MLTWLRLRVRDSPLVVFNRLDNTEPATDNSHVSVEAIIPTPVKNSGRRRANKEIEGKLHLTPASIPN